MCKVDPSHALACDSHHAAASQHSKAAATRLKDELNPKIPPAAAPRTQLVDPERNPGVFLMSSLLAADPALLFWSLAFIHIAGLVSMLLARLPRSHRVYALCHHGFFACLLFI